MSQRTPDGDAAGADLDEAVTDVTRGTVQKAVLGATLLADHQRRKTDARASELAKETTEERQRAAMDVLQARTGYAHAADPQWVTNARETELADAWVKAEPWRETDDVAARVHQLVGERLQQDWPDLAGRFAHHVDEGLTPAEAMRCAARSVIDEHAAPVGPTTEGSSAGGDDALRQAGLVEEKHAARHLDTPDDPATPDVDEHREGVEEYVHDTQRGRDLQAKASTATTATAADRRATSRYAPSRQSAAQTARPTPPPRLHERD